jgi:agmatinase
MTKQSKIARFDPNAYSDPNANLFGLPFTPDEAEIVIIPVPWEVTVSYGGGTAKGPEAVLKASHQVDLYDPAVLAAWKVGVAMDGVDRSLEAKGAALRPKAAEYIDLLVSGKNPLSDPRLRSLLAEINEACSGMNAWVKAMALHFMKRGKVVGLIGGDHSTPLGLIEAAGEKFGNFGILQIDAHADLRDAYEGFEFSHASIMFNALKNPRVEKLVQVGIRDLCEAEAALARSSGGRVSTFFDRELKRAQFEGEIWASICDRIIAELPREVYLSFDIDGLDPKLCPNTGTPVPGGLETEEVLFLLERAVNAGKRFIAFDINEVAPGDDEWDAIVGARLLFRIANLAGLSNGLQG